MLTKFFLATERPEEKTMRIPVIVSLTVTMLWMAAPLAAATTVQIDDVRFTRTVDTHDQQLHLQGAGVLKVMLFVKAYAGALYLPESAPPEQALDPIAKRLVLEYYHPIASEDFAKATRVKIMDNVDANEAERLKTRIDRLAVMYRDVKPGDRYALTYTPGRGTRLSLNGEHLGTIPGDDFAKAVFAIWLGANPIDKNFRDRLLGVS